VWRIALSLIVQVFYLLVLVIYMFILFHYLLFIFFFYLVPRNGAGIFIYGRYDAYINKCNFTDCFGVKPGNNYSTGYGGAVGML
jgi:hypothetical protein